MDPPTGISQERDEKTTQPLKFPDVLMRQIDRVLKALTEQSGDFMAGVEGLDMALAYEKVKDKKFQPEMDKIDEDAKKYLNGLKIPGGKIDKGQLHNITYARAKMRMEALLRLIGRAGYYPERQQEWSEE